MAKPETTDVTVVRIVPHRDKDGKRVPEKWDTVERTVRGVVVSERRLESRVSVAVARDRWVRESAKAMDVETPEVLR